MPYEYRSFYFDDPIRPVRALDVFEPRLPARDTALFFVHGGGWRGGSRAGLHKVMRAFNAEGFVCASTDYRLTGVTALDQLADARRGYGLFRALLRDARRPDRVLVYGESAGAHLAALLALAKPGECGEEMEGLDIPWRRPAGVALQSAPVAFEPWEDIFPPVWDAMQDIAGAPYAERPRLYRRVSPIEHVSLKAPPVLMLEAENEHMFPLEMSRAFVDKLRDAGARAELKLYARAEHGFFYDVTRRPQKEAFADILAFAESLTQPTEASGGLNREPPPI